MATTILPGARHSYTAGPRPTRGLPIALEESPQGLDEEAIALLEALAAAAVRAPWTLYPVPSDDATGPICIGPVEEPATTTATVESVDDARFIVALRNYLPALVNELKRLREG